MAHFLPPYFVQNKKIVPAINKLCGKHVPRFSKKTNYCACTVVCSVHDSFSGILSSSFHVLIRQKLLDADDFIVKRASIDFCIEPAEVLCRL